MIRVLAGAEKNTRDVMARKVESRKSKTLKITDLKGRKSKTLKVLSLKD